MTQLGTSKFTPDITEGDVLVRFLDADFSKKGITFENGNAETSVKVGTVLGAVRFKDLTVPAVVGSGNGTIGGLSLGAAAKPGDYIIKCTTGGASARFSVQNPEGALVGIDIAPGAAFVSPQLEFEITAGATDFSKGDTFTVTVEEYEEPVLKTLDPNATDGSQVASAVLLRNHDLAADAQVTTLAVVAFADVRASALIFPSSFDQAAMDKAKTQLKAAGVAAV